MQTNFLKQLDFDMPIMKSPFEEAAARLGIPEEELLSYIMKAIDDGYIKRFGAIVNHNKAGYSENALLAWHISEDKIDEAGEAVSLSPSVSHCYRRQTAKDWPYNLYAMLHAKNEEEVEKFIMDICRRIDKISPENKFLKLKTLVEYKKVSWTPGTLAVRIFTQV